MRGQRESDTTSARLPAPSRGAAATVLFNAHPMVIMSDSASDEYVSFCVFVYLCCMCVSCGVCSPTVTALLAMSEFFLSQRPPPVSEVARCLLAVLALNPVARVEASVRLRLGLLLSEHTSCSREARQQLEKTVRTHTHTLSHTQCV